MSTARRCEKQIVAPRSLALGAFLLASAAIIHGQTYIESFHLKGRQYDAPGEVPEMFRSHGGGFRARSHARLEPTGDVGRGACNQEFLAGNEAEGASPASRDDVSLQQLRVP